MVEVVRRLDDTWLVEAEKLDSGQIEALDDPIRKKIMEMLSGKPAYPSEIAEKLDIGKQQAYYHFRKLEDAGLIEKDRQEEKSGGLATYFRPESDAYVMDLGSGGQKTFFPRLEEGPENFLDPLVSDGRIRGRIVVGSPDQHGEDQVRARDGHLAAEIGMKLGGYATGDEMVSLDTEIVREDSLDQNLVILGGVLTNTMAKRFNGEFPVEFSTEDFPYHELTTPQGSYSEESIGVVSRTSNPQNPEKAIYLVAGVGNRGTQAAVRAFKNLEEITENYVEGDFYRVVRGLDLDGDGKIDGFEAVEE